MGKLEDKVALVTGPARGQGEAEARLFAAEHATVMMTDVLDAEASEVARSIGPAASYHRLDVTEEAAWTHMADDIRHGKLDMLTPASCGSALLASGAARTAPVRSSSRTAASPLASTSATSSAAEPAPPAPNACSSYS